MLKDFHDTAVATSDAVDHTLFTHLNPQQPSVNNLIDEFQTEWQARKKTRAPKRPRLSVAPRNIDLDATSINTPDCVLDANLDWQAWVGIPDSQPFL